VWQVEHEKPYSYAGVFAEAGIRENLAASWHLATVRTAVHGQVGTGKQVRNQLTGRRCLAELVVTLEQVRIFRSIAEPFGSVPPDSRLSSLLWQSVQRMRSPMLRRAWFHPDSTLGTQTWLGSELLRCDHRVVEVAEA